MSGGRRRKKERNSFSKEQMTLLQKELEVKERKQEEYTIDGFKSLFRNMTQKELCDIVRVKSGDKVFRANKKALESVSEYFKGLFRFSESLEHELHESVVQTYHLQQIIWYAYTRKLDIDQNSAQDLFVAANYLQIDSIQRQTEEFMAKHLTQNNALMLVPFANKFNADLLMDSICSFISDNFESVFHNVQLLKLGPPDLMKMLQNRQLSVCKGNVPILNPEAGILKLVGRYVNGYTDKLDESCILKLLNEIRFEEFTDSAEVKQIVEAYPCIDCKKLRDIIKTLEQGTTEINQKTEKGEEQSTSNVLTRRTFSRFNKHFKDGPQFITELNYMADPPFKPVEILDRIKILRLFIGKVDGRWDMIGGITIQYQSGQIIQYGTSNNKGMTEHTFVLDPNEVITRISVQSSGLLRILADAKFETNCGREFGPFGEKFMIDGVDKASIKRNYLHSMTARLASPNFSEITGLAFVRFRWVAFSSKRKGTKHDN